jgi:hypothetical protein
MNMNPSVQDIMTLVSTSGCLGTSERQKALLQYLLKEKERGCSEKIKAYNIAVDVLGRADDFDSATDSIVRVEMHRLRKNLEQFNGASKDLTLTVPRASYIVEVGDQAPANKLTEFKSLLATLVVSFSMIALVFMGSNKSAIKATPTFVAQNDCSSILPNVTVTSSNDPDDLHTYVGTTIRASLAQYTSINLVNDIAVCGNNGTPTFGIDYIVLQDKGVYRVAITTYNQSTSNIIGFSDIAGVLTATHEKNDLYYGVIKTMSDLAKPYGTIPQYATTKKWASEISFDNYRCLISMYDSFTTDSNQDYGKSLICLESSINTGLASMDNLGALALQLMDKQGRNYDYTIDPMNEANRIIESVGVNWVNSAEMVVAKITYEVERSDYNAERLEDILNKAEKRYGANPQVLLVVAIYSGYKLGDWERAKSISDRVKRIHSEIDNSVFLVDAAYALIYEDPNNALQTCLLTYSEQSLFSNLLISGCAKNSQNYEWANKAGANLVSLNYTSSIQQIEYLKSRNFDPLFTSKLVAALQQPTN